MNSRKDIQNIGGVRDTHVVISKKSIEIAHKGEPVSGTATTGYVYLLVDRSASMEGNKLNQAKRGAFARRAESCVSGAEECGPKDGQRSTCN